MSGVFISYRRSTSKHLARSIFMALQQRGHDVFLDVNGIDSGAFDRIIINQIAARPHFLLLLSSGALERCVNAGDWLRREIEEAFRLQRNIIPIFDEGFNLNTEIQFLPEPIRTELPLMNAPPYSHYYFDAFIQTLHDRFLKLPVDTLAVIPTPPAERAEVQKRIEQASQPNDGWTPQIEPTGAPQPVSAQTQTKLTDFMQRIAKIKYELVDPIPSHPRVWGVENILPRPFEWVYVPPGIVTIETNLDALQTFSVDAFNIAKYPITNAQFEVFIQAEDGYRDPKWWAFSKPARRWRETNTIPLPRAFPPNDHPRANVNQYEALAFCNWLANRFNAHAPELPPLKITLPTEQQWTRAALGDTEYTFPWGNEFESTRCNTKESDIEQTSPVTQYASGASVYGVMDMVGNVHEWTLSLGHPAGTVVTSILSGSWDTYLNDMVTWGAADNQNKDVGFRIVGMNTA